jgi:hypothetical protein
MKAPRLKWHRDAFDLVTVCSRNVTNGGLATKRGRVAFVPHAHHDWRLSRAPASRPRHVRGRSVAPGSTETEMLKRFTGTEDRTAGIIADVPLMRVGEPRKSSAAMNGS